MAASAATSSLLSGALGVFGLASTTRRRRLSSGLQTNAVPVDHTLYGPPAQQGIGSFLARPASQSSLPTPQFPTLEAPSLKNDYIDERATEPHWGSKVVQQAATALGVQELRDALSLQQLLPDRASSSLRQVTVQLQEAAAAVQQAVATLSSSTDRGGDGADGGAQLQLVRQAADQLQRLAVSLEAASVGDLLATQYSGYSLQTLALVTSGVAALVALSVPGSDDEDGSGGGGAMSTGRRGTGSNGISLGSDFLPSSWDPDAVAAYYSRRPVQSVRRVLEVTVLALSWGGAFLSDLGTGTVERNMPARAEQLMRSIEQLGPAYIKVAQALSTRVDLLPPAYLVAIQRLQDGVQTFPDALAMAQIQAAFGRSPLDTVFSTLSPRAVAAASLGQVYRGTLVDGREVAIKCRRPGVLESVSLDLHLMRGLAMQLRGMPEVRSDWVGILDLASSQFLDEMSYEKEARNTIQIGADLAHMPGILVPTVIEEGSTDSVLVTSWVEGERLSERSSADVRELCDTLLSAYLHQLCSSGLLHADSHAGNLLVTPDGRVAILDHGLVQRIPPELSLTLIEYISHLMVQDWDSIADDLVRLGFVDDMSDRDSLVGPLGIILTELSAGGGAKKININLVMQEIDKVSAEYNFKIPPYFTAILRTFSVIEGIALQCDPDYSIVKECLPYLSRRLLVDSDDPRAREALRGLLYAGGDRISLERLELILKGASNYSVQGLGPVQQQQFEALQSAAGTPAAATTGTSAMLSPSRPAPLLDSTAKEVLLAVFARRPTYVQELLVGEAASTADAAGRQLAALLLAPVLPALTAWQQGIGGGSVLGGGGGQVPLPPVLALISNLPSLVELSPEDRQQLVTAQGASRLALEYLQQQPEAAQLTPQQTRQLMQEVAPLLPQLLPGVAATGQLFVRELAQRSFGRISAAMGEAARS